MLNHSKPLRHRHGLLTAGFRFIDRAGVKTVAMADRIIGCPHEEGIDYEGPTCPRCPYWAGRDRWTGEMLH